MFLKVNFQWLLLFELLFMGVFGQDWSVMYTRTQICALNGSTVFMHASYTHPPLLKEVKKFWVTKPAKGVDGVDVTEDPEYSNRTEYFEGEKQLFALKLRNVTERDEQSYCLRITSNTPGQKYLFYPGVRLRVTGLRVEYPEHVSEKDTTLLTCKTTCPLTETPTYVWYKNGRRISTKNESLNILVLQPTRIEDTGSYSCAVRGYEHRSSPAVSLSVRYPPKNVSVSISPSGEIVKGSSVTLTCSSDANPPVVEYNWFKDKQLVGKAKYYTISNISSEDGGEYKCKISNAEGHQYSAGTNLTVSDRQSYAHNIVTGVIVSCTAICFAAIIVVLSRKKMCCWSEDHILKQVNVFNTAVQTPNRGAPQSNTGPVSQDENYASIVHRADSAAARASASEAAEEVLYASVQHRHDKVVQKAQKEDVDVQYASVTFNRSSRPAETVEDPSVIYSTVK